MREVPQNNSLTVKTTFLQQFPLLKSTHRVKFNYSAFRTLLELIATHTYVLICFIFSLKYFSHKLNMF